MKLKISERELRLLLLLIALVVFAGAYFLVYLKNTEKTNVLKQENETLENRITILNEKMSKQEDVLADTKAKQDRVDFIMEQLPEQMTQEKIIMILDQMEKTSGVHIGSIAFDMNQSLLAQEVLIQSNDPLTEYFDTVNDILETTGNSIEDTGLTSADEAASSESVPDTGAYVGLVSFVQITFEGTYKEVKDAIDYIYFYDDKMSLQTISTIADQENNLLVGTMQLGIYSMTGSRKEYVPPVIDGVDGKGGNIFR